MVGDDADTTLVEDLERLFGWDTKRDMSLDESKSHLDTRLLSHWQS